MKIPGPLNPATAEWANKSAWHTVKAQEYESRLENLDHLSLTQKAHIFTVLKQEIASYCAGNCTFADVTALNDQQSKAVLIELHIRLYSDGSGLSEELNEAQFKAVRFYSSERAKGKIAALYGYMWSNSEGRTTDHNGPGLRGSEPTDRVPGLPSNLYSDSGLADTRQNHHSRLSGIAQPDPLFRRRGDENSLQLLEQRRREGWFSNDIAEALMAEEGFSTAMWLMNVLIVESNRARQYERTEKLGKKKVRELLGRKFTESVKQLAVRFLLHNIKNGRFPRSYHNAIPPRFLDSVAPESTQDEIDCAFIFDLRSESSPKSVPLSLPVNISEITPATSVYHSFEGSPQLLPDPKISVPDEDSHGFGPEIYPITPNNVATVQPDIEPEPERSAVADVLPKEEDPLVTCGSGIIAALQGWSTSSPGATLKVDDGEPVEAPIGSFAQLEGTSSVQFIKEVAVDFCEQAKSDLAVVGGYCLKTLNSLVASPFGWLQGVQITTKTGFPTTSDQVQPTHDDLQSHQNPIAK